MFLQLNKHGLAYKKKANVNWCPSCETVLANEQVINGRWTLYKISVGKKDLEQWFQDYKNIPKDVLDDPRLNWKVGLKR